MRSYIKLPEDQSKAVSRLEYWERMVGLPVYRNILHEPYVIPAVFFDWWNICHQYMQGRRFVVRLKKNIPRSAYVPKKTARQKRMEALQTFLNNI